MLSAARNLVKKSPVVAETVRNIRGAINGIRYASRPGVKYICPICSYHGPFISYIKGPGFEQYEIKHTQCPRCELYERHRLQHLAVSDILRSRDFSKASVLHFAPEPRLARLLRKQFAVHHTADLYEPGVTFKVDITAMPFHDGCYEMLYASHVLEHVIDIDAALREIKRVLKPGGVAVLPVPIVSPSTIEYGEANPFEFQHVRACGIDFFDRYRQYFKEVVIIESAKYPEVHQLYTYELRDFYPTCECPKRAPMDGMKHPDYVPICLA